MFFVFSPLQIGSLRGEFIQDLPFDVDLSAVVEKSGDRDFFRVADPQF